jgi:acyl transferase domain-containing protein
LFATHFACQSIWSGESETAIAVGLNLILWPEFPIVMSAGKYLFSHSFCKAFDEDAAGYGREEKAGIVIRLACTESKVE